jgi:cytochrome c-type biogenesis protein
MTTGGLKQEQAMAVASPARAMAVRRGTFPHALAFVLGFSAVFILLGASVAFVGYALAAIMPAIVRIGGTVLIVFGLQVMGLFGWIADRVRAAGAAKSPAGKAYLALEDGLARVLYTEGRVQVRANHNLGYLSSALMGVVFSAGWIPCVGPVLAAIYLLASDTGTIAQGALLLLVYSAGMGIPFLLTGAAFGTVSSWLRRMNRHLGIISKITGLLLIAIGFLLITEQMTLLNSLIVSRFGTGLATISLESSTSSAVSIPLAFVAGLLSFLSPCVLPLIPGYIGYLSGQAVADGKAS